MSDKTISTVEDLDNFLKTHLSEKRYIHSVGVAETTEFLLDYYGCSGYEKEWKGFRAGTFCGLIHDIAREYTECQWIDYCKENSIEMNDDEKAFPVLVHGKVSALEAKRLIGDYPKEWFEAVCLHTVGDCNMDQLALALFIADFTEPSRVFMTDEKRKEYYANPTIESCAYAVLSDMMKHWSTKSGFKNAKTSIRLLEYLKEKTR